MGIIFERLAKGGGLQVGLVGMAAFLWGSRVQAQPAPPQGEPAPVIVSNEGSPEPVDVEVPAEPAPTVDAESKAEIAELKATLAEVQSKQEAAEKELRESLGEVQAKQEEAEMSALLESDDDLGLETELFKVYGFMDMGINRTWVKKNTIIDAAFEVNALTFMVGNVNLYFDFNPDPNWRGLAEIRFTGAPHGLVNQIGTEDEPFERNSTQQTDPHGSASNGQMWGGYTVIERAWVEWHRHQQLRVRVGSFFTPFGIWNVDHGSPTLISIVLPQFMQQTFIPIRQTGVQLLGSVFAGSTEIAYRAWLTNGRTDLSLVDFTDDKAFGGRVFVRNDGGDLRTMFGVSAHHGRVSDKNVTTEFNLQDFKVEYDVFEPWAYHESIFGADVSVDIGDTRIRAEAMAVLEKYEDDNRRDDGFGGAFPDRWRKSAYLLVAQQLPWFGLEPFVFGEVLQQNQSFNDAAIHMALGLNVRFSAAAQLKSQVDRTLFYNWGPGATDDGLFGPPSDSNLSQFTSRIVLAF